MYLIVFDSKCLKEDRQYYFCQGQHFERIISLFPTLKESKASAFEEVLICSVSKEDAKINAKVCRCKNLVVTDTSLKVDYDGEKTEIAESCENIRKRLYAKLLNTGIIKKGEYPPFVVAFEEYQAYLDVKETILDNETVSFMEKIEKLKTRNYWRDIVNLFPKIDEIENSKFWDNSYCLNELYFALAKLAEPGTRIDFKTKRYYENYFFKVINRCIELEPYKASHKSVLAYHYYSQFRTEKKNRDNVFEKAEELYLWLIENSQDPYKEKYRYAKLKQTNFEIIKWAGGDNWIKNVNEITSDFKQLIDEYASLSEDRQKRYKKEYVKSLFGYTVVNIENLLQYYKAYTSNVIFKKPIGEYFLQQDKMADILKCDEYLHIILDVGNYKDKERVDLQHDKPNYFEVYYRLAQIEQMKGLIYILKGEQYDKYAKYFSTSNIYVENVLALAKERKGKENFSFPYYTKCTKAINYHFLNQYEKCHECFYNAKPWMIYEQGVLYYLQDSKKEALKVLKTIPQSDTCYNKAQTLINKINDEN